MVGENTGIPPAGLVTVQVVQGHLLAETIKARLESEGIPVALRYESVGRVLGITVDGLGQVEIVVPEAWAERAKEILESEQPPEETDTEA